MIARVDEKWSVSEEFRPLTARTCSVSSPELWRPAGRALPAACMRRSPRTEWCECKHPESAALVSEGPRPTRLGLASIRACSTTGLLGRIEQGMIGKLHSFLDPRRKSQIHEVLNNNLPVRPENADYAFPPAKAQQFGRCKTSVALIMMVRNGKRCHVNLQLYKQQ